MGTRVFWRDDALITALSPKQLRTQVTITSNNGRVADSPPAETSAKFSVCPTKVRPLGRETSLSPDRNSSTKLSFHPTGIIPPATDAIDYVTTDANGLTSTSTSIVSVEPDHRLIALQRIHALQHLSEAASKATVSRRWYANPCFEPRLPSTSGSRFRRNSTISRLLSAFSRCALTAFMVGLAQVLGLLDERLHLRLDEFRLQPGEILDVPHLHQLLCKLESAPDIALGITKDFVAEFRAAHDIAGNVALSVYRAMRANPSVMNSTHSQPGTSRTLPIVAKMSPF